MMATDGTVYELEQGALCKKLLKLRENGILTDITLACYGREIQAHRCILSASSRYFRHKFCQGYGLSYLDPTSTKVDFSEQTGDIGHLQLVVDFMYKGTIAINQQNIGSILNLAVFCGCDDLVLFCAEYLRTSVSVNNCIRFYFNIHKNITLTGGPVNVPGSGIELNLLNEVCTFVKGNINDVSFLQKDTGVVTQQDVERFLGSGMEENLEVQTAVRFAVEWLYDHLHNIGVEGCLVFLNFATAKAVTQNVTKDVEDNIFGLRERLKSFLEYSSIDSQLKAALLAKVADILTLLTVADSKPVSPKTEAPSHDSDDYNTDDTIDTHYNELYGNSDPETTENDPVTKEGSKTRRGQLKKLPTRKKAGSRVFECKVCHKKFGQKNHLTRHLLIHKRKPFQCSLCRRRVPSKTSLIDHMTNKHADSAPYECDICKHSCTDASEFVNHKDSHSTPDMKEEIADEDYDANDENGVMKVKLTGIKLKDRLGINMYPCVECGKSFKRRYHLTRHRRSHRGERPYQCEHCDQAFADKANLEAHINKHNSERPFECENCDKKFYSKAYRNLHYKICTNKVDARRHKCRVCDKLFFRTSHLRQHMTTHSDQRPFQCEKCAMTFKTDKSLVRHNITLHSERAWAICDICGKSFAHKESLRRHMIAHTGARPYTCEICSKSFTQKTTLTVHMRGHTGVKSYQCDLCAALFFNSSALMKHRRNIHLGLRPHACEVCDKSFGQRGDLNRHMAVHTGIKKYKCPVCLKAFSSKGRLPQHMRTHTGEKPHGCLICGHAFIQKGDLKKHMGTHNKSGLTEQQRVVMKETLASKGREPGSRLNQNLTAKQRELLLSKVTDQSITNVIDRSLTGEQKDKLLTNVLQKSLQEAVETSSNVTSELTLEIMTKQMQAIVSDTEFKEHLADNKIEPIADSSHNLTQQDVRQSSSTTVTEYTDSRVIPDIHLSTLSLERPYISTAMHIADRPVFPIAHTTDHMIPNMENFSERPRMAHMPDRPSLPHVSEQPSMAHMAHQSGPLSAHTLDRLHGGQGQPKYWPM